MNFPILSAITFIPLIGALFVFLTRSEKGEKNKSAILCGKTFFYPVKNLSTIIIKDINDLKLANYAMKLWKKNLYR